MPKINDIEPQKRSIRDINIKRHHTPDVDGMAHHRKGKKSIDEEPPFFSYVKERENSVVYDYSGRKPGLSPLAKIILWATAALSVLAVVVAVFSFFSGAKITILPLEKQISVDGIYTAKKIPSEGELKFDLISISKEVAKKVKATGTEKVEKKAVGEIMIYNNHSTAPQALVVNTRFETPEGLIFRLQKAITVPGKKTASGTTTPGSIKASVIADNFGEKYNIGLTDFTIPGFKGSTKYDNFYARSVDKMSGGFLGEISKVSSEDMTSAESELTTKLKTELIDSIKSEVPEGFVFYDNSIVFDIAKAVPKTSDSVDEAEIVLSGTAKAVIFNKEKMENFLKEQLSLKSEKESIKLFGISKLSFNFSNNDGNVSLGETTISFKLGGMVNAVWLVDENLVKKSLAGKGKAELSSVLSEYPSVVKAESYIVPLWQRFYPDNIEKITIEQIINAKD